MIDIGVENDNLLVNKLRVCSSADSDYTDKGKWCYR